MTTENNADLNSWERKTLEKVLNEAIKEQKRSRRWRIFFRLFYLALIIAVILMFMPSKHKTYYDKTKSHTALITIRGEIADGAEANADDINESLDEAFDDPNTKAVMLQIDSPGGSPVQAGEIYDNLTRLKKHYPKIKTYAVCTDMCASGAYYVAAATDYIYADKASLVGSIGVLMDGFGFVGTIDKIGVERRLMTSGSEKGFLDPFSPVKPQDQAYMQQMLDIIHQQFIAAVKQGRGPRLKNDPLLFSGLVWTGQQAAELGLVDGLATPDQVLRNVIEEPNIVDYTLQEGLLDRFANKVGSSATHSAAALVGLKQGILQ